MVARLTRNIRIKGSGDDGGASERFGAVVAVHRGLVRMQGVEVTSAGQFGSSSQVRRHAVMIVGSTSEPDASYIRKCSIHRSWNVAVVMSS